MGTAPPVQGNAERAVFSASITSRSHLEPRRMGVAERTMVTLATPTQWVRWARSLGAERGDDPLTATLVDGGGVHWTLRGEPREGGDAVCRWRTEAHVAWSGGPDVAVTG